MIVKNESQLILEIVHWEVKRTMKRKIKHLITGLDFKSFVNFLILFLNYTQRLNITKLNLSNM